MEPRMPADANGSGGLPTLTTPIRLLYRGLLGSALANIGAWARANIPAGAPVHRVVVVVAPLQIVACEKPPGCWYWLKFAARHKPRLPGTAVIQVLFVAS
jgi:hypothetical protein